MGLQHDEEFASAPLHEWYVGRYALAALVAFALAVACVVGSTMYHIGVGDWQSKPRHADAPPVPR